jgi:hypothetical protein
MRIPCSNLLRALFSLLSVCVAEAPTRESVNARIDKSRSGVFYLREDTFDDFINYNDLVLICFHETGDLEEIVHEMLDSISHTV